MNEYPLRAQPLRGTEWLVIKPFTVKDAQYAAAGILLSWLARVEMQTSDDSMRVLPAADWRDGPEEFVQWLRSKL